MKKDITEIIKVACEALSLELTYELNILIKETDKFVRAIRQDIHMYPELGTEETRTAELVKRELQKLGVESFTSAETGVVGTLVSGKQGVNIAFRADMDALPIVETTINRPHTSKNKGVMHACGHDGHTAILLGVVKFLVELNKLGVLKGEFKFCFQPAEETVGGAERMISEGILGGSDYAIGLHVVSYNETGEVELKYGKLNASSDTLDIEIKGTAAHGAYPHMGIDAVIITAQIITALQSLISRRTPATDTAVLSFGKINGGSAGNILADSVRLVGTLRTTSEEIRAFLKEEIVRLVEGIAISFSGKAVVKIDPGYMSLNNTKEVMEVIEKNCIDILGKDNIIYKELPGMGVEDFSFFIDGAKKGGAFFHLGCASKEKGIIAPAHNENFDIDEDCLLIGVLLQVVNAIKLQELE